MAVFGSLLIVIIMGEFYQFPIIAGHSIWGKTQIDEDHNRKTLWLFFSAVIILIKQMYQQSDPIFVQLPRQVRKGELTEADVSILNEKVVTSPILNNLLNNIVIVPQNKIRHLINRLQIKRFAHFVDHNIVIFPAQHSHTRKEELKAIL